MATLTYEDESELSDHSSLAEEDLNLERDRKRKANKVGYHRPLTYFAKAGEAADPRTKKSERTPKYSIASALKTAGAVALIGAAWTAKKPVHNATITGQAIAAVAAAKVKRKGDPEKSVAAALKKVAAVAIVGASWTAQSKPKTNSYKNNGLSLAGAVVAQRAVIKARNLKKFKYFSVAEALRVSGAVAVAAAAWCPQVEERTEDIGKISEEVNEELEAEQELDEKKIENLTEVKAPSTTAPQVCTIETQTIVQTPQPKLNSSDMASSPIQILVAKQQNHIEPSGGQLLKPMTRTKKYSSLRKFTPAYVAGNVDPTPVIYESVIPEEVGEPNNILVIPGTTEIHSVASTRSAPSPVTPATKHPTPPPSVPLKLVATPAINRVTPTPEVLQTAAIIPSPNKVTPTPSVPLKLVATPAINRVTPSPEVLQTAAIIPSPSKVTPTPSVPSKSVVTPAVNMVTPPPSIPLKTAETPNKFSAAVPIIIVTQSDTPLAATPAPSVPLHEIATPANPTPSLSSHETPIAPSVPLYQVETPIMASPSPHIQEITPAPSVPLYQVETPIMASPSPPIQEITPAPSVPLYQVETPIMASPSPSIQEITPAPSVPSREIETPTATISSPFIQEVTPAPSVPLASVETPEVPATKTYEPTPVPILIPVKKPHTTPPKSPTPLPPKSPTPLPPKSPTPLPPKSPTPLPPKTPTPLPPKTPTPVPESPKPQPIRDNLLAPVVLATTVTKRRPKVTKLAPVKRSSTPAEEEIEEIPLPQEEKAVLTANNQVNPKPKRRSRGKLTPLERLVAKTRSLA